MSITSLKILNGRDIEQIHNASLQVLKKLGVKIEDHEIREKLHGHGCIIEDDRVKFNLDLIEAMLSNVKSKITFTSRAGISVEAKDGVVLTHTSSELPFIIDLDTGQKRDATSKDLKDITKLMNRLKWLDMPSALVCPSDIPPQINQIKQCEVLLKYSEKPFLAPGGLSAKESEYIVELFNAVACKDASLSMSDIGIIGISPESPLYYPQVIVDKMKIVISAGIPTDMLIGPVAGLSAPMTLSGGLVQMNASMLAFATIAYLINPDTPIIYGARLSFINMKTGNSIWGLPDVGIAGACSVQMAGHYGFLSDVYGLSTTACTFDNQAGYEKCRERICCPDLVRLEAFLLPHMSSLSSIMRCFRS
jgi:trimethylamine--corrinoid protein Co-methyltransferase